MLDFSGFASVSETRVATLPVGDYHCEYASGARPPVFFERKSLPDLFGTMTRGYQRFRREILAAQNQGWKLILLVEAGIEEVYRGHAYSNLDGETCMQKVFTLWARYNLQPVFCQNRSEAAAFVVELYEAIGRNWEYGAGKMKTDELFGTVQLPLVAGDD